MIVMNERVENLFAKMGDNLRTNRYAVSVCLLLTIVTLTVFWQVTEHEFINFDDNRYITENQHVLSGISPATLKWALTTSHTGYWHPLTWFSHMLDVQLFGLNAGRHHLMNVFLHIMNTLLLFLILRRTTKALWQSAFVAALFALHPLHVESVAWAAERKDVMSTLFWMLTLGAYAYYVERPGYRRYLFALVCFLLGLMVKPMLVTIPFVLLLFDYWPLGRLQPLRAAGSHSPPPVRPKNPDRKKQRVTKAVAQQPVTKKESAVYSGRWSAVRPLLLEKAPFLALSLISSVITIIDQQRAAMPSLQALPVDARIANALVSYVKYIGMTIWPRDLAVFYPRPDVQPWWLVLGAVFVLLAVTWLVLRKTQRFPYLGVGWLLYLGTLLPVIGLLQAGSQAMADRYSYVSLIGIFIMVAWGAPDYLKNWPSRKAILAALSGTAVLACIVLTWLQLRFWQNSETLFRHALKVTTNNVVAHNNLGTALLDRGNIEDARDQFQAALRIDPKHARAWNNMGTVYEKSGQTTKAIETFQQALRISPEDAEFWNNLGVAYGRSGQTARAVEAFQRALRINPEFDEAWNNLGNAYGESGEIAKAIPAFRQALHLNPKHAKAWNNLGVAYGESGEAAKAVEAFNAALRINPKQPDVWNNLGIAYRKCGEDAKAIEAYREALSIKPDYTKAWFGLAAAYRKSGQSEQAREAERQLRAIDPTLAAEFSGRVPLPEK
jgi:protein O-mannosyl-transferase